MPVNPFILANKEGIPRVESIAVNVTSSDVQFKFHPHNFMRNNFSGLVLVKLSQVIPSGTTTSLPIVFTSESTQNVTLTTQGGEPVTVANITTGVYLTFFEKSTNTLQLC